MRVPRRLRVFRLLPLMVWLLCADARADVQVSPPVEAPRTAPMAEPAPESRALPLWVWLVPPAGLILGLGLGARLRRSASKRPGTGT